MRYRNFLDFLVNDFNSMSDLKLLEHEIEARREGEKIGDISRMISTIRAFKDNISNDMLMKGLNIDRKTLDNIIDMIDNYPDRTDEDIAYEPIFDDDDE